MDVMVLRPGKGKWILILLISGGFTALGTFISINDEAARWTWAAWTTAFFGIGVIVSILQLVPGVSELRLSAEGFMMRSAFRNRFYRWADVSPFYPIDAGGKLVGFELLGAQGDGRGADLARALSGAAGALPDTYGLSVEDLAALMNDWRSRALDLHPQPGSVSPSG